MNQKNRNLQNKVLVVENICKYIVLIIFIKPSIVENIPILDLLFNAGRMGLSVIYIVFLFISKKKIKKEVVYLWIISLTVLTMTCIHSGSIQKVIAHFLPSIGLIAYILLNSNMIMDLLRRLVKTGYYLLIANLISFFAFPNGILFRETDNVKIWILGQKQDLPGVIIPLLFFAIIVDMDLNKKSYLKIFILGALTTFFEKSVAAFLCITLLGILCVFDKYLAQKMKKQWLIVLLLFCFVGIQYISYNFEHMLWFQKLLLHINTGSISKVRTLGTRFNMWKYASEKIFSSPITGVGELSREVWIEEMGYYHSIVDNMYMDILLWGGIFSLWLFVKIIIKSFTEIEKVKNMRYGRYLNYTLFVMCIYLLSGSPFLPLVYLMLLASTWFPYINLKDIQNE